MATPGKIGRPLLECAGKSALADVLEAIGDRPVHLMGVVINGHDHRQI